jgi:hypothetical protein
MFAKIEKALVDRGQVGAVVKVQKVARVFETPANKKAQRKWIEDAMGCELKTHLLLQSEHGDFAARNRLEQYQRDGVVMAKEQQEAMDILQDSLSMYNKWWFQTRNYHEHLFNKPKGSYIRYHELYVEGHLSYTREQVQEACRALGGCCAYGCGCCYRARKTHRMGEMSVFMHCTRGCDCCVQRRKPDARKDIITVNRRARNIVLYDYLRAKSERPPPWSASIKTDCA